MTTEKARGLFFSRLVLARPPAPINLIAMRAFESELSMRFQMPAPRSIHNVETTPFRVKPLTTVGANKRMRHHLIRVLHQFVASPNMPKEVGHSGQNIHRSKQNEQYDAIPRGHFLSPSKLLCLVANLLADGFFSLR